MALMLFFSPSLSCFIVPPSRNRDLSSAAARKENKPALGIEVKGWMERALHPKPGTLHPFLGL